MNQEHLGLLAQGTLVTIGVTVAAVLLAAVVALVAGAGRSSRLWAVRAIAGLFIEVFRGTSALVQLYIAFFVLPLVGITLSPFWAGVIALGLNGGAYGAEVVRAGLASVPRGLMEAARTLDMPTWARFRHVVLPSAMLIILRPAGNLVIDLLKASSLVSLVTLQDLTYQGQFIRNLTGDTAFVFFMLLLVYFALSSTVAWAVDLLDRRMRRGLHMAEASKRTRKQRKAVSVA